MEPQQTIRVDSSWADELPKCILCGKSVSWNEGVLMPCSTISEYDEPDTMGVIHGAGCK